MFKTPLQGSCFGIPLQVCFFVCVFDRKFQQSCGLWSYTLQVQYFQSSLELLSWPNRVFFLIYFGCDQYNSYYTLLLYLHITTCFTPVFWPHHSVLSLTMTCTGLLLAENLIWNNNPQITNDDFTIYCISKIHSVFQKRCLSNLIMMTSPDTNTAHNDIYMSIGCSTRQFSNFQTCVYSLLQVTDWMQR